MMISHRRRRKRLSIPRVPGVSLPWNFIILFRDTASISPRRNRSNGFGEVKKMIEVELPTSEEVTKILSVPRKILVRHFANVCCPITSVSGQAKPAL